MTALARRGLRRVMGAALAAFAVVTTASFLGDVSSVFDLLAHLRPHFAAVGLLASLISCAIGARITAVAWIGLAAVHAFPVAKLHSRVAEPRVANPIALRALLFNVRVENPNKQAIADWIDREAFDVVVIQEATDDLCDRIDRTGNYRRIVADLQSGDAAKRSSAIHVRLGARIVVGEVASHRPEGVPGSLALLEAHLEKDGARFVVLTPRVAPPVTSNRRVVRARMFDRVVARAREAERAGESILLIADLNTTPFARDHADLLARASLRDAGAGRGYCPTFRGSGWLAAARLPIDFVLVSRDVAVLDHSIGEWFGSDHRPVIAALAIPG